MGTIETFDHTADVGLRRGFGDSCVWEVLPSGRADAIPLALSKRREKSSGS
jgi:hypothetical protein